MEAKREEARVAAAAREAEQAAAVAKTARIEEVIPYLRKLGFRADAAHHAAEAGDESPDASLEQRVKRALARSVSPRILRPIKPATVEVACAS